MKKFLMALSVLMLAVGVNAQHVGTEYRLKKVVEVPGRQGIAADKDYFYVSDTLVISTFLMERSTQVMKSSNSDVVTTLQSLCMMLTL